MDQLISATVRPTVQVILEGEGDSWSAYVPGIPGCAAVGDSPEEARQQIEEALTVHLDALHRQGLAEEAAEEAAESHAKVVQRG